MNEDYKGLFTIAARNQWLGFAGAPKTLFASGTLFVNRINTQFGLKFYADQIGYNTITNASLSYSYMVMLDNDWSVDLGLAGSFQSLSYDRSKVNTYTADDPALYENLLQSYNYNCDVGAELMSYRDWETKNIEACEQEIADNVENKVNVLFKDVCRWQMFNR